MNMLTLTIYVLIWPVLVAGVLAVLCRGFFEEWLQARRDGKDLI
ncbi:membrane protein [Rhodococcus gordoniae]|uniref:Membrane protein n=1 Tax=Rhodococcus gordoniae TaxID=223392 RepID=A0A379LXJ4_9NOCA|nr:MULTISPECIES: putative transporter small subunit [Rhodococcus]UTT46997.1 putative transporter small subunit [Rhodococcus gordoniae]SUE14256.1 membrane protein [Rhodococcus gordoniae]